MSSSTVPLLILLTLSLEDTGGYWLSDVTSPQGLADSAPSTSGTYEYDMPDFYTDVRDLNSVPHAHVPNSLSIE